MKKCLLFLTALFLWAGSSWGQALTGGSVYPINNESNPPVEFANITEAVAYITVEGVSGAGQVIFELGSEYNSATEPGPITIGPITGTSSTLGITFRPTAGVTAVTSIPGGASPNQHAINLAGCSYVTLDGRAGGVGTSRDWTVAVTGTTNAQMAVRLNNTSGSMTGINIRYLIMEAAATGVTGAIFQITGVTGNTISDIVIEHNLIQSGATLRGYGVTLAVASNVGNTGIIFSNNDIRNFTARGINLTGGFPGIKIHNINIYNTIPVTGTAEYSAIYFSSAASPGARLYNNFIYDIELTAAPTSTNGIYMFNANTSGDPVSVYNNVIVLGDKLSGTAETNPISGIRDNSATGGLIDFHYNSVALTGTVSSGSNLTAAFRKQSSNFLNISNNNFYNNRSNGGTATGTHWAIAVNNTNFSSIGYNNYYAGGTGGVLGSTTGTTAGNQATLAAWKAAVPADATSVSENPNFIGLAAIPPNLRIDTDFATQLESGGLVIAGITDDFDGTPRFPNVGYPEKPGFPAGAPDIGAFEFGGEPLDLIAPAISYTALGNTTSTAARTLVATITDASGVPTAGTGLPVLYWRIDNDPPNAYVGATAVHLAGNDYEFTFGAGVTSGDVVEYYIVAQDMASPPNVGVLPSAGAAGFSYNPPAVSTPPTSPEAYTIVGSISGTFSVGTAKSDYPTLTGAGGLFEDINNKVVTGNVIANIISDITEPGTFALNQWDEEGAGNYTLTIQPDAPVMKTLSGSSANGLIRLNGADRVIFDGGAGKNLTIENTNAVANTAAIQLISLGTGQGCEDITIKNCIVMAGDIGTTTSLHTFGIYAGSAAISISGTGADNENLVIENNIIKKARYAIYARGASVAAANDGLVIAGNEIGSSNPAEYVTFRGIDLAYAQGPVVSQNYIHDLKQSLAANNAAIEFNAGVNDGVITRNIITGVYSESTSGYGAYGINFSSTISVSNNLIANNFISDLRTVNYSNSSTTWNAFGIRLAGGTGTKVYFNSVNLFGEVTVGTGTTAASAPLVVTVTSVTGLELINNIFANTQTFLAATSKIYSVWFPASYTGLAVSNHNAYYGTNGVAPNPTVYYVGRVGTTDYTTLLDWQGFTTQDASSVFGDPQFVSNTDLHINTGLPSVVNNAGVFLAAVPIDIDGEPRDPSTPDIGADEYTYTPPACPQPISLNVQSVTANSAMLAWTESGSATTWEIEVVPVGDAPTGVPTATANTNPYNYTGLLSATSYNWYVKAACNPFLSSLWAGPSSFTTACAVYNIPISEDFDAVTAPALPICWSNIVDHPTSTFAYCRTTTGITPNSPPNQVEMYNSASFSAVAFVALITPEIDESLNTLRLRFYAKRGASAESLKIGTMTDPTDKSTFTELSTIALTTTHTLYTYFLDSYAGTDKYIAFVHGNSVATRYIYLDNIIIDEIPSCLEPVNFTASNVTTNSADLAWTSGGSGESLWNIKYGIPGFDPDIEGTLVSGINAIPYTLSGLTPFTDYDIYVQADCGGSDLSLWTGPLSVKTLGTPLVGGNTYPINNISAPPVQFVNLAEAFSYLGVSGVTGTGQVIMELGSNYDSSTEPGSLTLGIVPGTDATLGVTFRPATGATALTSIAGELSPNQHAIRLAGPSYITFDGRAGGVGSSLDWTIRTTGTNGQMAVRLDHSAGSMTGLAFRYLIMEGEATNVTGAIFQMTQTTSANTISDVVVENNLIQSGATLRGYGMTLASASNVGNTGIIIRNNKITGFYARGINLTGGFPGIEVYGNSIYHADPVTQPSTTEFSAIYFSSTASQGAQIYNNYIHSIKLTNGITAINGLYIFNGNTAGEPVWYYNNRISIGGDLTGTAADLQVYGLRDASATGALIGIYYNTVHVTGNVSSGANSSAAFRKATSNNITLQNNIFYNSRSGGTGTHWAIMSNNTTYTEIGYNDYFADGVPGGVLGTTTGATGGNQATLAAWQIAVPADIGSISVMPNFLAGLKIDPTIATGIESGGTPIAGITTDFEGDLRNPDFPDIGADEFDGIPDFTCTTPAPGTTLASVTELCFGASVTFSLQNATPGTGVTYQWQSSTDNITYADITGETSPTYTTVPEALVYYRCLVTCQNGPVTVASDPVQLDYVSSVVSTTPGSRCGTGTVVLEAEAGNPADELVWYALPAGGSNLGTGSPFTTPVISETTTFYVSASAGGGTESAGKPTYATSANTTGNQWGLVFDVVSGNIVIQSVDVYSVGTTAGQMSVELRSNTGVLIETVGPFNYPAGSTGSPVTVTFPLNLEVPVGTGYRLLSASMSGGALIRETSGNTYPYTSTSGNVVVTSGFITNPGSASYYWFYNWQVSAGCESARVPVVATVTPAPALTITGSQTVCSNEITSLTVTSSLSDYDTYTWSPVAGLFTDPGCTVPYVEDQHAVTVYVKIAPTGDFTYFCNAFDSGTGCANATSTTVTVLPLPPVVFVTPDEAIADGTVHELVATGGTAPVDMPVLTQNFNSGLGGWTVTAASSNPISDFSSIASPFTGSPSFTNFSTLDGGNFMMANSDAGGSGSTTNTSLVSPVFSLAGSYLSAKVTFEHIYFKWTSGDVFTNVEISTDGGTNWNLLINYVPLGSQGDITANAQQTTTATLDLTPYLNETNLRLRFRYENTWGYYWLLDDIVVAGTLPGSADYTWSPATNLWMDAAATIPYTGQITSTVYANPTTAITYEASITGANGCVSVGTSEFGYSVSGTLTYFGNPAKPLDNVTVNLMQGATVVRTTVTGIDGTFVLGPVQNGSYSYEASTIKARGGTNVADVNLIVAHLLGNPLTGLPFLAADVNDDGLISVGDYNLLVSELLGSNPVWAAPDWIFSNPAINVSGSNISVNFMGICSGDPDGSYNPPLGK